MYFLLILQLFFIFYYSYAFYVFYKLNENLCECKKLELFKNSFKYNFLFSFSLLFLLYNVYYFFKLYFLKMTGGSTNILYVYTLFIITLGYGLSFFYDYILLTFFSYMKDKNCPCQKEHRKYLTNITYIKLTINILLYISLMSRLNQKKFNIIFEKIQKYKN